MHLRDRETRPDRVLDFLEEGVVASGRLGATLDDVTGGDCAGKAVVVLHVPAELPHGRSDHKGSVGDTGAETMSAPPLSACAMPRAPR